VFASSSSPIMTGRNGQAVDAGIGPDERYDALVAD
jgi:hypothetical protein